MDEIVKMIYEHWRGNDENNIDWGNYLEAIENIHNYLNGQLANDIESEINKQVWAVEENAFVAGFKYACECISNGKSHNLNTIERYKQDICTKVKATENELVLVKIYTFVNEWLGGEKHE